nr:uncharacterized protein LOC110548078 [Meriones unguiculatus]
MGHQLTTQSELLLAAQIMLGLIHGALGTLWLFLYNLEDEKHSVGPALMITSICYLYVSGLFFINSGSSSVIQGDPVTWQLVLVIVMNTISIFVSVIGLVIFGSGFSSFEEIGKDYIWSNMVGMMLLHISVLSTSSELIIAIIMVHRCKKAFKHVKAWDERAVPRRRLLSSLPKMLHKQGISAKASCSQEDLPVLIQGPDAGESSVHQALNIEIILVSQSISPFRHRETLDRLSLLNCFSDESRKEMWVRKL